MSDVAQASDNTIQRTKYRPAVDGPRMKVYMAEVRAKNKAGFKTISLGAYKKLLASQKTGE